MSFSIERVLVPGLLLEEAQRGEVGMLEALLHWVESSVVAQQCAQHVDLAARIKRAIESRACLTLDTASHA